MKTIKLTQGYVTKVSNQDFKWLSSLTWNVNRTKSADRVEKNYARRKIKISKGKYRNQYMHRFIVEKVIGRTLDTKEIVDHIDGDSLNNVRDNLRVVDININSRPFQALNEERHKQRLKQQQEETANDEPPF